MHTSRRGLAAWAGLLPLSLAACATAQADTGLTRAGFAAWLDKYGAAWSAKDAAAAGALFTADASYHEMPFDAPMQGRAAIEAYWTRVTAPQSDIRFSYEIIAVEGDQGAAHWRALFNAGGAAVELNGMFAIAFAEDGVTARSLREWWHVKAG
ncbi:MAG: nuclear transport factor 2 family protein [Hyphomonadaceae bacterium]|nr:nuclear transport factor 2 family protein [Hyphomonadaceae bacterium]